jgi:hypothetical protein
MMISFEFPQSLKNSATMFQATVRQPATTYLIDGSTRPPIGIPSTTTRSSGLALNNEAQKINMVERSNQESINSSSKGPMSNGSTTIKYSFS